MAIETRCKHCGTILTVADEHAGKQARWLSGDCARFEVLRQGTDLSGAPERTDQPEDDRAVIDARSRDPSSTGDREIPAYLYGN